MATPLVDPPVGPDHMVRTELRASARRCAVLCLLTVAVAGANLILPLAIGHALDRLVAGADATRWVLACAALVGGMALLDGCEEVLTGTTNARTTARMRERLVRQVCGAGPRATARFTPGDLVARLIGNANQAGAAPATLAALLAALVGPLGAVVALGLIDPWLAAVFLGGAPVLALVLKAFTRASTDCVARYQHTQGEIAGLLTEAIGGARTIAAAHTHTKEEARVLRPLPELSRQGHRMWRVQGRSQAQALAVAPLLQLGVLAVAGHLLMNHRVSLGDVLAASRYAMLATGIGVLVGQLSTLVRARTAGRRLDEVLTEPMTPYGASELPAGNGKLELRGVTARRGKRTVLDGVDLVVPAGHTLAVVGRSGAGKSLLAALAGRLADPDEGTVLLDGVPLRELGHEELRRAVGYAFERPALLGATIEGTIGLGLPAPGEAGPKGSTRIREAARAACADAFVRSLPEGYATPCAEAPLSGGEAQRLGLARAFARGGRLLVLDDALSSLDTVTEHRIAESLLRHTPESSRLIIAHRAATAARADLVAWLDGGRIRAMGAHAELWQLPEYRAVFGEAEEASEAEGPEWAGEA
ncbi:ABC transporter ATP-binding protein [Actinomycetota bacterium Odt1-20B]